MTAAKSSCENLLQNVFRNYAQICFYSTVCHKAATSCGKSQLHQLQKCLAVPPVIKSHFVNLFIAQQQERRLPFKPPRVIKHK